MGWKISTTIKLPFLDVKIEKDAAVPQRHVAEGVQDVTQHDEATAQRLVGRWKTGTREITLRENGEVVAVLRSAGANSNQPRIMILNGFYNPLKNGLLVIADVLEKDAKHCNPEATVNYEFQFAGSHNEKLTLRSPNGKALSLYRVL